MKLNQFIGLVSLLGLPVIASASAQTHSKLVSYTQPKVDFEQSLQAEQAMQQKMLVEHNKFVKEGEIYRINTYRYGSSTAVGRLNDEFYTFNYTDEALVLSGTQTIDQFQSIRNYELSRDGKQLAVIGDNENNTIELAVYRFDADRQQWQESGSYQFSNASLYNVQLEFNGTGNALAVYRDRGDDLYLLGISEDGTISLSQEVSASITSMPNRIESVSFVKSDELLIVAGSNYSFNSDGKEVVTLAEYNSQTKLYSYHSGISKDLYSSATGVQYDEENQHLFFFNSSNVVVQQLDLATKSLSELYNQYSYNDFNTYLRNDRVAFSNGQYVVIDYNRVRTFEFKNNRFSLVGSTSTPSSSYSNAENLTDTAYWQRTNHGLDFFDVDFTQAQQFLTKKGSVVDGQFNLPRLDYGTFSRFIGNDKTIIGNNDGFFIVDSSTDTPVVSTKILFQDLGFADDNYPTNYKVFSSDDRLIVVPTQFINYKQFNHQIIDIKINDDGNFAANLRGLGGDVVSMTYPVYSNTAIAYDFNTNTLVLPGEQQSLNFFSVSDSGISSIDSFNLQNTSAINHQLTSSEVHFIDDQVVLWDRNRQSLLTINNLGTHVNLNKHFDFSQTSSNSTRQLLVNGNKLYFVYSGFISSYQLTDDQGIELLNISQVDSFDQIEIVSTGYALAQRYDELTGYGIDDETGTFKKLESFKLFDDFSIYEFGTQALYFGNQQFSLRSRSSQYKSGFSLMQVYRSPLLKQPVTDTIVNEGQQASLDLNDWVYDADRNETFTYSITGQPAGSTLSDDGLLSLDWQQAEQTTVDVTVTDSKSFTLDFSLPIVMNAAPTMKTIEDYWVNPSTSMSIFLADYLSDNEGHQITVSSDNMLEGLSIKGDVITGQLSKSGKQSFDITATDELGAVGKFTLDVNVNSAPMASTISSLVVTSGESVSADVAAAFNDIDQQALNFTSQGLPSGLSLSQDGKLSGTSSRAGQFNVVVTATDTMGLSSSNTMSITIEEPASSGGSLGWLSLLWLLVPTYRTRVIK